jgi:NAD/NADP transhydrogenase beta subunit
LTALPSAAPGGAGGLPTAASGNVVKAVDDSGATLAGAAALATVGSNVASILDHATTSGMKVQDVDGLTFTSAVEVLLAVIAGKASVSGSTIAFKRRDGSTTKISVTCAADGERTSSVINS